jgi:hypothetical protein
MRKLTALALIAVPLLVVAGSADAKNPDRCRVSKGGTSLERTRTVLVYQRDDSVIACLRPDGRRYYLGQDDGIYNTLSIDKVGRSTVTWSESYTPECKADCPPNVTGSTSTHTINLRTGKVTDA